MKKRRKGKNYKGGSFPLLNLIEEMKDEKVEMLPNTRWEAAHPVTRCGSRLAHLDILKALQTFMECNWTRESESSSVEIQSEKSKRSFKSRVVKRESSSIIRGEQLIETANLEANKTAWVSPIKASIRGNFRVLTARNFLEWSRKTAVATAKVGPMATSKLTLKESKGGGSQSAKLLFCQANKWCWVVFLIHLRVLRGTGIMASWISLFLANQI